MTGSRHERLAAAGLYLIASHPGPGTPRTLGVAWRTTLAAAVDAGITLVQLRVKAASTSERRILLHELRADVGPDVLLVVNDDLDAVFDERGAPLADGVHLGRTDAETLGGHAGSEALAARRAGLLRARSRLGPDLLLGTSTRTCAEIELAVGAGADHVGFGALSISPTKTDTAPADRAELGAALRRFTSVPIFPIGGLGPDNLADLVPPGTGRAAVGSALLTARDVRAATQRCLAALGRCAAS